MKSLNHVFALAPDCHTAPNYSHLAWRRHIYEGIRRHVKRLIIPDELDYSWARQGHGIDLAPYERERATNSELLLERIRGAHREHGLDTVFSYCYSFDLDLEVVRETVRMGVPWINFYCDSTHMFEKVEALARTVTLNWFPENAAVPRYQALGVPHLCAPYAMNPDYLRDLTNRAPVRNVAFIGLPTSNRITELGFLRLLGCPVEIRGHKWIDEGPSPFHNPVPARRRLLGALRQPNMSEKLLRRLLWPLVRRMARGPLSDEDFPAYVRDSLVLLGLNQGKDSEGRFSSYLKFRDIEFPGYGCCYLTERNSDLEQAFEIGKEILAFESVREAAAQIREIERNPEVGRAIGRAGRKRVLESHSWEVRLRQLAERL